MSFMPEIHHRKSIRLKGYDYTQAGAYFVTICVHNRLCLFGSINESVFTPNAAGVMIQTVWKEMPINYEGIGLGAFVVMPNHIHAIINITDSFDRVGAGPRACPGESAHARELAHTRESAHTCESAHTRGEGNHGGLPLRGDSAHTRESVHACGEGNHGGLPLRGGSAHTCDSVHTCGEGNHGGLPLRSLPDIVHRYKTMTTKRYVDGVKNDGWSPFQGKLWQRNYYEHIIRNDDDYRRIEGYIHNNPKTWKDDKLWTDKSAHQIAYL